MTGRVEKIPPTRNVAPDFSLAEEVLVTSAKKFGTKHRKCASGTLLRLNLEKLAKFLSNVAEA